MASSFNRGEAPYYDGFDNSKQYSSVLFRPGFVVQTQELNELQSILKQNIRNISGVLLADGDIIEGCQCIVTDITENSVAKKCTITAGRIYLNGDIHPVPETTLTLKGAGTETIGVKIVDEVITEKDDPDLLDNAAGYANAQMSGAHRQKTSIQLVLDDSSASTIYTFVDGNIINVDEEDSESTILNKINVTLARRTYDESGNYRVEGLQLSEKGQSDDDYIYLTVSAGKSYIKGNELTRNVAYSLPLARATDLRTVETEVQEYSTGTTIYPLNNSPVVRDNLELKAYVQATTAITKGVSGGSDPFPSDYTKNSIASLIRVWDSGHGDYEIGSNGDCRKSGNSVKWTGTGSEPSSGSTYNVTFSYIKTMVYGKDYDLYIQDGQYCIRILNSGGDVPINSTNLLVDYKFMLYRRDLIVQDSLGNIKAIKGQSDTLDTVASPINSDENLMVLGSVLLTPLSDNLGIINNQNKRLSMNELQRIAERLSNVEESLAITDLDNEAMDGEDATSLVGIYTDGFVGLTKADVDHNLFDCSFDLDNQELTVSAQETLNELAIVQKTDVSPISASTSYDSLITAPATETKIAGVETATGVKVINQYAVFSGNPVINITPRQNNWIDTNTITVQGATVTRTVTLRRWWYHGNESWVETEKAQYIALGFKDGGKSMGWNSGTATATHSAVSSILNSAIKYMQQIRIYLTGQMFDAYTDNIIVTFNGNKINATAQQSVYKGTHTGTLKANVDGFTQGYFTVPANTLCGTVEVQMYPESQPLKLASTTFTSNGTLRTTTKVVWKEVTKVNPVDPLAQTFQFDKDQFITSVGLYFCKSDNIHDVSIQIRGTTNGYPNQTCYGEKIIAAKDLKLSAYGETETKVVFDDPIYCLANTQYAICILTESTTTSMYYAELGGKDVKTGVQLIKNPYMAGLMFSSSNAIAWTAHQGSNLKFNIYGNTYKSNGYVYFKEITNVSYDRIMVMADVSTPDGTSITWEYSEDGGLTWYPMVLFNDMELSKLIGRILIRAKLNPSATVSPAILKTSCYLIGFLNNQQCNYISRNIVMDEEFHQVKQKISIYDPDNTHTSVVLYYATDVDGNQWKSGTQKGTAKNLGSGWYQYTFEDTISSGAKNYRARILLTTNDSTYRPRVKNLMSILT